MTASIELKEEKERILMIGVGAGDGDDTEQSLDELSERDRVWLFGSGLLCCPEIENELESWTREIIPPKRSVK